MVVNRRLIMSDMGWQTLGVGFVVFLSAFCGCTAESNRTLRIAVTTSTRDSGLLDRLIPGFEELTGARVDVVAVGSGAALKLGAAGDVDAVLCHSEDDELQFMQAGHGRRRELLMQNSFVVLGPRDDPACIAGLAAGDAFFRIRQSGSAFVSRGDQSGTHRRELRIWQEIAEQPDWLAYMETGQGMGRSLVIADEKNAYTLSDYGTFKTFQHKIRLVPYVVGSESLVNRYSILLVDRNKNSQIQGELADRFADYLISGEVQRIIADYRVHGESLFVPLRLAEVD